MAYLFYKAVTDDGGAVGTEIASGELNALFNTLSISERLSGTVKYRKMYIDADADTLCYVGITDPGEYESCLFASTGSAETVGDLTGTEDRFGSAEVVSATGTDIVVKKGTWTLFRVNDNVFFNGEIESVTSVTDNGDGTETLSMTAAFSALPAAGEFITSVLTVNITSGTAVPFWRENLYAAGAAATTATNTVTIVVSS